MTQPTTTDSHVLKSPLWLLVIRGLQILLAVIILALSARLMHDAYLDEEGLALAISLITWFIVAYIVFTEKLAPLHRLYNIYIVIALDAFMVVLWLATFAAVAARRATYKYYVDTYGCSNDGSLFDGTTCFTKRGVIFFKSGLAMFAAIAGLGALVWLLFIATFGWGVLGFLRGRKEGRFAFNTSASAGNYQLEPKTEGQPVVVNQQAPIQQAPIQQQPTGQYQVSPEGQYAQQVPYQQTVSPYQQNSPYPPPQDQQAYGQYPQQQYQQPIQPQATGQSYQNPATSELSGYQPTPIGSELAGSDGHTYGTPPPGTSSPPPQQYHQPTA